MNLPAPNDPLHGVPACYNFITNKISEGLNISSKERRMTARYIVCVVADSRIDHTLKLQISSRNYEIHNGLNVYAVATC